MEKSRLYIHYDIPNVQTINTKDISIALPTRLLAYLALPHLLYFEMVRSATIIKRRMVNYVTRASVLFIST